MRSLRIIPLLASLFVARAATAQTVFSENFENGTAQWSTYGGPVVVATDTATCSTSYQHETDSFSGGRVFSSMVPVTGGATYCFSAWMRASSDATPFLGLETYDANGSWQVGHWLIGNTDDNGFGAMGVAVTSDDMWHWYAAEVTLDASSAFIDLMNEMYTPTSGYADFDDIAVTAGPCATAYAGANQHQVCGNDMPVCSADGSCQALPPSPTPDMGSSPPSVSFPGATSGVSPSTPVAAEGAPAGGGAVTTTTMSSGGGGCSMSGSEGDRAFGITMLAFAAVMLLAIRRRRA